MILEHSSKNKKALLLISIIILALGVFLVFYSPIIFQEGNPWPQIKGILKLNFSNNEVVKLNIGENKYITKGNNPEIIKSFMKGRGYDFTEQMGAGYLFKTDSGASAVATHRYYSRFYSLWTITEENNAPNNNLWTTTTNDQGITFQYPDLITQYIRAVAWPPAITFSNATFNCEITDPTSSQANRTMLRQVDNRSYCLQAMSEGAAGSTYTEYIYTTEVNNKLITARFTLRFPQCLNYDDPQKTACQQEREAFDLDQVVDKIVLSIHTN
ncbi:MAG: hypothetical protein ACKKL5_04000 [Candidatus Komeilibacteria bacterium]